MIERMQASYINILLRIKRAEYLSRGSKDLETLLTLTLMIRNVMKENLLSGINPVFNVLFPKAYNNTSARKFQVSEERGGNVFVPKSRVETTYAQILLICCFYFFI